MFLEFCVRFSLFREESGPYLDDRSLVTNYYTIRHSKSLCCRVRSKIIVFGGIRPKISGLRLIANPGMNHKLSNEFIDIHRWPLVELFLTTGGHLKSRGCNIGGPPVEHR